MSDDPRATVLGIDLGTSSVKAVVARLDGSVAGQATGEYPVSSPRPGWSETSPADWLSATASAVRAAVARAGGGRGGRAGWPPGGARPAALALSGKMRGVGAPPGDARPVRPAMLWSDAR